MSLCVAVASLAGCGPEGDSVVVSNGDVQIIPLPQRVVRQAGHFSLDATTVIVTDGSEEAGRVATWLSDLLGRTAGVRPRAGTADATQGVIRLRIDDAAAPGHESYRLAVTPDTVTLSARAEPGLFYGAVSLWQLATAGTGGGENGIPAMRIDDAPRFAWRGLMLDPARHFIPPRSVKQMIDWMALHKLNVLHWHLTDDQGWRLQIDAFPRLTEVGAWRVPAGRAARRDVDPETGAPRRYGGYYTKPEVRDIVAHAAARHVTIVPEIEMPGHAQAAIAAWPELGAGAPPSGVSSDWGIHDYLFNVEESTFSALETILAEVIELFPGRYIHVGGDEAVKTRWIASGQVQARMQELGVPDEAALQSWFVKRIERYLDTNGRRLIGWDEILEGGIAPRATVMSWRGIDGAVTAAGLGHDTVLSPWPTLYFDHRQGSLPQEPPGRGIVVTLEDVYRFDPMPAVLEEAGGQHVLGLQANVWTEHIRTPERVAWMTFPRAAALAEVGWSPPERRDWDGFLERLALQLDRYRALDIPFATSAFDVRATARPAAEGETVIVELSSQSGHGDIRYTVDGSAVTPAAPVYSSPLRLPDDATLAAATFAGDRSLSRTLRGNVGRMARSRHSQELEPCSESILLSLEDDAPLEGDRSVFLVDIMNPCWIWRGAPLAGIEGIAVTVGQLPFNFQIGEAREQIDLPQPVNAGGEVQALAGGCDGDAVAVLPLAEAAPRDGTTTLSQALTAPLGGDTDLCFRIAARDIEPLWAIDRVELIREDSR